MGFANSNISVYLVYKSLVENVNLYIKAILANKKSEIQDKTPNAAPKKISKQYQRLKNE
jgi:hypothetical protein